MNYHLAHLPAVQSAIAVAAACNSIEELQRAVESFKDNPLCETPAMPGRAGSRCSSENPVMILGKAPAGTETETRVPFSGPMGQVLREEMELAGLDIESCWITCASPWKAKKNNPNATLLAIARPFLMREIDLVKPSAILCLGQKADEALTQKSENLGDKPGTSWELETPGGHRCIVHILWCHAYVGYGRPERAPIFRKHLQAAAAQHPAAFAPLQAAA